MVFSNQSMIVGQKSRGLIETSGTLQTKSAVSNSNIRYARAKSPGSKGNRTVRVYRATMTTLEFRFDTKRTSLE